MTIARGGSLPALVALTIVAAWTLMGQGASGPGRVNHEGRALPAMPKIDAPILFNTPAADAVLAAMQVFPKDNPWNEDISARPVLANSAKMIQRIGEAKKLAYNLDMAFVIVPANQPKIDVKIVEYPDESDKGPFPVPDNAPIEGWPIEGGSLANVQANGQGDRHMIVVDPVAGMLHEFYIGRRVGGAWQGACEATFDLKTNAQRPAGWTSSDAAGLPIFPAVARYDECERGKVEHALRVTFQKTRREFIYPATHFASALKDADLPAMGQRFRLKASVDISGMPKHARAMAYALKKYGMFVADNGGDWRISVAPDKRIQGLDALRKLRGADFEVIQTTGPRAGR
ncbi:MAG: hypothetical protein NTV86_04650 [Planctomycetota bacterium]|nr:hypothetical protein [Planctomycetota bacterium]